MSSNANIDFGKWQKRFHCFDPTYRSYRDRYCDLKNIEKRNGKFKVLVKNITYEARKRMENGVSESMNEPEMALKHRMSSPIESKRNQEMV
jgi:hypothetical protein